MDVSVLKLPACVKCGSVLLSLHRRDELPNLGIRDELVCDACGHRWWHIHEESKPSLKGTVKFVAEDFNDSLELVPEKPVAKIIDPDHLPEFNPKLLAAKLSGEDDGVTQKAIFSAAKADWETGMLGTKLDHGKPMPRLLPPRSLLAIADVLTFGAAKYAVDNWKWVEDAHERYTDALFRHLYAWQDGERNDPESGLHHLAHAGCCLLFLLWFELRTDDEIREYEEYCAANYKDDDD